MHERLPPQIGGGAPAVNSGAPTPSPDTANRHYFSVDYGYLSRPLIYPTDLALFNFVKVFDRLWGL